jgi:hypothetical protein
MATSKTATKTKKAAEPKTSTIEKDVSLPFHADHCMVLTVKTVMTKYPKQKATFEYELFINNVYKGFTLDIDSAAQRLYELARIEIHERRMLAEAAEAIRQRALVELEAAAGVPEAVAELQPKPNYTIEYNRVTKDFDLLVIGGIEPLHSAGSYLEAETYARKHFNLDPLPF